MLEDRRVSHRVKLAALWASLMFCYIYCDYFELYQPGKLQSMLAGRLGPMGPVTQGSLLMASALLAVPALMIALCTLLPVRICRAANMALGVLYTLVMVAVLPGTWYYFKMFGAIESVISASIAWFAFKWPTANAPAASDDV